MDCACLCGINGKFPAWQSMSYPLYVRMEGCRGAGLVGVIYISASHCPCAPRLPPSPPALCTGPQRGATCVRAFSTKTWHFIPLLLRSPAHLALKYWTLLAKQMNSFPQLDGPEWEIGLAQRLPASSSADEQKQWKSSAVAPHGGRSSPTRSAEVNRRRRRRRRVQTNDFAASQG